MSLKETLQSDLRMYLREKDDLCVVTLRGILAEIQNEEKRVLRELDSQEAIGILTREKKKYDESLGFAHQAARTDLIEKFTRQLCLTEFYLPAQLTDADFVILLEATVEKTGASTLKDMGAVMKELQSHIKGRFDGKLASQLVKERLFRGTCAPFGAN
jgi:uncharacterized protein